MSGAGNGLYLFGMTLVGGIIFFKWKKIHFMYVMCIVFGVISRIRDGKPLHFEGDLCFPP